MLRDMTTEGLDLAGKARPGGDDQSILQGDERVHIILELHVHVGDLLKVPQTAVVQHPFTLPSYFLSCGLV